MKSVFCENCGGLSFLNSICGKCESRKYEYRMYIRQFLEDDKNVLVVPLRDELEYTFNPQNIDTDKSNEECKHVVFSTKEVREVQEPKPISVLSWDDDLIL